MGLLLSFTPSGQQPLRRSLQTAADVTAGICRCDCSDSDDYCKSPEAGASLSSVAPAQDNVERATFLQPFLPGTRQCPAVLVGLAGQGAANGGVQPHACAQERPAGPTAGGPPSIL